MVAAINPQTIKQQPKISNPLKNNIITDNFGDQNSSKSPLTHSNPVNLSPNSETKLLEFT